MCDQNEKEQMGHVNCSKVYVDKGRYGFGVFAKEDYKQGEILETGLMMRMVNVDGNENGHLFTWSDDKTVWACGSGCLPYYNHSFEPNVKKVGDLESDTMIIVALRDIKKNEELVNTYHSAKWRKCFKDLE